MLTILLDSYVIVQWLDDVLFHEYRNSQTFFFYVYSIFFLIVYINLTDFGIKIKVRRITCGNFLQIFFGLSFQLILFFMQLITEFNSIYSGIN